VTSTAPTTGHLASPWRSYLRRGALPVVLGIVVGVVLAAALVTVLHKAYTATASVAVSDTGLDTAAAATNGRTTGTINLDTEAQLVTSTQVIQLAQQGDTALAKKTVKKIRTNTAVSVPANTTVLAIAYTDRTSTAAADGANALAHAYLDNRLTTAQNQLIASIKRVTTSRDALTSKLQTLYGDLHNLPSGSTTKAVVQSQISQTTSQITLFDQQLVALDGIVVQAGRVITAAVPPSRPSSPNKTLFLGSGFALGLLLGLFAAWLRVRFRRRVRSVDDLEHVVDVPCVAAFRRADPTLPRALAAYRHLTAVVSTVLQPPALVVVTSPLVESACSHVAGGLAAALTRRGLTSVVLQIHGDEIDSPRLTSVHVERVLDADDVMERTDPSLPAALDRIRGEREMLVVDAPGGTVTPDAQVMGAEADAVLVVVAAGTRSRRVRQLVEGLDSVGAPILGTVLVERAETDSGSRDDEFPPGRSVRADRNDADVDDEPLVPDADEHANGRAGALAARRRH
jgi:capsular polysaccharide biosynthesis protein